MKGAKKLSLLGLPLLLLPALVTSCGNVNARKIDPSVLTFFNGSNIASFNHLNSWSSSQCYLNTALNTNIVYQDTNSNIQGGLIIDESDLASSRIATDNDTWFSGVTTKKWMNDSSTSFTGVFRDGLTYSDSTKTDNVDYMYWTDAYGNKVHPQIKTQFNRSLDDWYKICPEDIVNEFVYCLNPWNYMLDSGFMWLDEVMDDGEDILSYIKAVSGIEAFYKDKDGNQVYPWSYVDVDGNLSTPESGSICDSLYNSDFNIQWNKDNTPIKTLIESERKGAVARYNCEQLAKACLDGTYQKYVEINGQPYLKSLRGGEGNSSVITITSQNEDGSFNSQGTFTITDSTFGKPTKCTFLKIGIGNNSYTQTNNDEPVLLSASTTDPWFFQMKFTNPKQYLPLVMNAPFLFVMADRAINWGVPANSGINYETLTTWDKGLYSGHYSIDKYFPNQAIVFKQNPSLKLPEDSVNDHIKKIVMYLSGATSTLDQRYAFQSGDVTLAQVSPEDIEGWNKNIGIKEGQGLDNPVNQNIMLKFNDESKYTKFYMPCYFKGLDATSSLNEPMTSFTLPSVRAYFTFMLNRNNEANYYAGSVDKTYGYSPNSMIYNPDNDSFGNSKCLATYAVQGDDYVEEAQKVLVNGTDSSVYSYAKIDSYLASLSTTFTSFTNENLGKLSSYYSMSKFAEKDMYRFNPYLGLNAWAKVSGTSSDAILLYPTDSGFWTPSLIVDSFEYKYLKGFNDWIAAGFGESSNAEAKKAALDEMVHALEGKVAEDLNACGFGSSITLTYLINGASATTSAQADKDMVSSITTYKFANGNTNTNSPLKVDYEMTANGNEYKEKFRTKHLYAGSTQGWQADYDDPINTIRALLPGGSYDSIGYNFSTLLNAITRQAGDSSKVNSTYANYLYAFKKILENTKEEVSKINAGTYESEDKRKYAFGPAENDMLFKYNLFLPTCYASYPNGVYLTYMDRTCFNEQSSSYLLFDKYQTSSLATFNQNQKKVIMKKYANVNKANANNISEESYNDFIEENWVDSWGETPSWEEFSEAYLSDGDLLVNESWKY